MIPFYYFNHNSFNHDRTTYIIFTNMTKIIFPEDGHN